MNSLNSSILEGIIDSIKTTTIWNEEKQLIANFYNEKIRIEAVCRGSLVDTVISTKTPFKCRLVGRIESDQYGIYFMAEHIERAMGKTPIVVKTPNTVKWKVREKQSSFEF